MPLSKERMRERKRQERAAKKEGKTTVLPKSLVRLMRAQGIDPTKHVAQVSMEEYRDLKRTLDAKTARVEWQSGGIARLQTELANLQYLKGQNFTQELVMKHEMEIARLEAMLAEDSRDGL